MTAGMATIAGSVLAAYAGMMLAYQPEAAGHLVAASIMSAPAAFVMAKLLVPETGEPVTAGTVVREVESPDVNVIDAAARGAGEGLRPPDDDAPPSTAETRHDQTPHQRGHQ